MGWVQAAFGVSGCLIGAAQLAFVDIALKCGINVFGVCALIVI